MPPVPKIGDILERRNQQLACGCLRFSSLAATLARSGPDRGKLSWLFCGGLRSPSRLHTIPNMRRPSTGHARLVQHEASQLRHQGDFRQRSANPVTIEQSQGFVQPLPTPSRPTEALSFPSAQHVAPNFFSTQSLMKLKHSLECPTAK